MSMGDRGWRDSTENYCDGWSIAINGSTATAIQGIDYKQAAALIGLSLTFNQGAASGTVSIVDGSATGDAGDTRVWQTTIGSGNGYSHVAMFTRPLALNTGLIVSAATVTGSISLLYKSRY